MRMYIGWCNLSRLPQPAALCEEAHVFTCLKELYNDGAPASRGAALCEAAVGVPRWRSRGKKSQRIKDSCT